MSLMDSMLLTLLNTVICLVLPKLLSVVLAENTENPVSSQSEMEANDTVSSIPSYVDIAS